MTQCTLFIGLLGLGEAGSLFAKDLVAAGHVVKAYDPATVATPDGVERCATPAEAVADAEVIMAVTGAADAEQALLQAFERIPDQALYADFSTGAAKLKRQLGEKAAERNIAFADVALLAVVPGKGLRTEAIVSGSGAELFVQVFGELGMPVTAIGSSAGDAATRKLLRSVFMKGLAALIIEAVKAGEKAGLAEWLWGNIANEISRADETLLRRLVSGTGPHARRRLHEMEACEALLTDLGVDPVMTKSTVQSLKNVLAEGLPEIPLGH